MRHGSPFQGMDPFIEGCGLWEDFHDTLITEIKKALLQVVPDRYTVRSGERSYIVLSPSEGEDGDQIQTQSDVAVSVSLDSSQTPGRSSNASQSNTVATSEAPVSMRALITAEHRETFVEIRDQSAERRLVTSIELLSPSNKRFGTPGWSQYLRKRQAHLEGQANFIEIDLLRGGRRMPMQDDWPRSPYYLLVSRKKESPKCTVWPAHFRRSLPEIPVPLSAPDPDVPLALQPLIDSVYVESRYSRDIDYGRPCRPALADEDSSWLLDQLRAAPHES